MKSVVRLIVVVTALLGLSMGITGVCEASAGDVNGDSRVDVFDALMTLQYAVGLYTPPDKVTFEAAANVAPLDTDTCMPQGNTPTQVNVFDALAILRHAVGLDPWDGTCPPPLPPATYAITGKITYNGAALSGVGVSKGDLTSVLTLTDGTYTLSGLQSGAYSVTPLKSGYTFTPQSKTITIATADVTGIDFTAATVAPVSKTVNSAGNFDAGTANYAFYVQSSGSDYTYTIANFRANDQLVFPAGTKLTVDNPSWVDGVVNVIGVVGSNKITVVLTGIANDIDVKIYSPNSFNTAFGPGSLLAQ